MKNLENTIKQMIMEDGAAGLMSRMFGGAASRAGGSAARGAGAARPRPSGMRGPRAGGSSADDMGRGPSMMDDLTRPIEDPFGFGVSNAIPEPSMTQGGADDFFGVPSTPQPPTSVSTPDPFAPKPMAAPSGRGMPQRTQPPGYMSPDFSPTPMMPQPEVPTMMQPPEEPFSMVPRQQPPQDPMVAAAADEISNQAARGTITPPKPAGMAQDPMAMPGEQAPGMGGAPQPRQPQGGPSSATVSAQDQLGALNEPTMFDGMPQPQAQQPPMGGQGMGMPQQPPMGRGMPQPQAVPTSPMPKAPPMTDLGSPMPQGGMSPDFSMTPQLQPQLQPAVPKSNLGSMPVRTQSRTPQPSRPPQPQAQPQRQPVRPKMATATKTARPGGIGFNFGGEQTPFSASDAMLRYGKGGQSQMLDPTMPTEYSQEANPMDMERMRRKQMFRQQIAQRSFQNPGMAYESFMSESNKKKMKKM